MDARPSRTNLIHIGVMAAVLIGAVLIVAIAASPLGRQLTGATQPQAQGAPAKIPAVDVTLSGTVGTRTAADGTTEYTLTTGDSVVTLDAGPAWFFPNAYPLAPYVGQQVTVGGEQKEGATTVDVLTVNDTALREPGKPPWAGGWKTVGEQHPGWTQEKADRQAAKAARQAERNAAKQERFGLQCWPPGHCNDGSARDVNPGSSQAP